MKRLKLLVVSALLVTLVTGCGMKAEYKVSVSKDKKVSIEIVSAMDDEMIDYYIGGGQDTDKKYTDKERWDYLEQNSEDNEEYKDYKASKYDKDGFKGYTYTLDLGDIDKLITEDDKAIEMDNLGKDSKLFTKKGDVYSLNIKVSDDNASQMEQYAQYVKFDAKFTISLPNKAKSNNATSVSGNTYTWDLTKAKDIKLSFDITGKSSSDNKMLYIIGGCVAGVGVIAIATVVIMNNKKKKVVAE